MGGLQNKLRPQHSKPKFNCARDHIKPIWVRQHFPLHQRISLNILREIVSYLGESRLIVPWPSLVVCYDVVYQVHTSIKLQGAIECCTYRMAVWLPENNIFLFSGHCPGVYYIGNKEYIIQSTGEVWEQPKMIVERSLFGTIYCPDTLSVYVFGGVGVSDYLHSCERFLLSSFQWERLPDLKNTRSHFAPCLYYSLIFLGGGLTPEIEIFDTKSNLFIGVLSFILPQDWVGITLLEDETLLMLTTSYTCKWNLRTEKLTTEKRKRSLDRPVCSPILYGNKVYSVSVD